MHQGKLSVCHEIFILDQARSSCSQCNTICKMLGGWLTIWKLRCVTCSMMFTSAICVMWWSLEFGQFWKNAETARASEEVGWLCQGLINDRIWAAWRRSCSYPASGIGLISFSCMYLYCQCVTKFKRSPLDSPAPSFQYRSDTSACVTAPGYNYDVLGIGSPHNDTQTHCEKSKE